MSNETKTKTTETPKAEPHVAASQYPFSAFDPMAAWTAAQANFQKLMGDSFNRGQAWADEYAAIESQMFTRLNQAIDTWAQLAHDTINYTAQLSVQARKMGLEAARKTGVAGA